MCSTTYSLLKTNKIAEGFSNKYTFHIECVESKESFKTAEFDNLTPCI